MAERRNPYFILGLDYGAAPHQAQAAFARLSRRLRRVAGARYGIEDATWALHEIEHAATDPSANLATFRVPANPAAYDYPPTVGVLSPPSENLPRRTGSSEEDMVGLRAEVVCEVAAAALTTLTEELLAGPGRPST